MSLINEISMQSSIIDNFINMVRESVLLSSCKKKSVDLWHESIRYCIGSEFPLFNGVFQNDHFPINSNEYFENLVAYFAEKKANFMWWWLMQSDLPPFVQEKLNLYAFQNAGICTGMAVRLDDINPVSIKINKEIEIKNVTLETEHQDFVDVASEVFHFHDKIKEDFRAMTYSYNQPSTFRHYIAYLDKQPIATLTSYFNNKVAGFYNGATLPAVRKNGICLALIEHAIKEARTLGCQIGVAQLMDDSMARGLLKKLGFKQFCQMLPFVKLL